MTTVNPMSVTLPDGTKATPEMQNAHIQKPGPKPQNLTVSPKLLAETVANNGVGTLTSAAQTLAASEGVIYSPEGVNAGVRTFKSSFPDYVALCTAKGFRFNFHDHLYSTDDADQIAILLDMQKIKRGVKEVTGTEEAIIRKTPQQRIIAAAEEGMDVITPQDLENRIASIKAMQQHEQSQSPSVSNILEQQRAGMGNSGNNGVNAAQTVDAPRDPKLDVKDTRLIPGPVVNSSQLEAIRANLNK